MIRMLLLDGPSQGVEPVKIDVPWDASREECDLFVNRGSCRPGATDLVFGKCSNALCPLGILRPLSGNRVRALRSGSSSPCSGACVASKAARPAKLFLPQQALVASTGLFSTVASAGTFVCGADAPSAAVETVYDAHEPSSLCSELSYGLAQHPSSQVPPATSRCVGVSVVASSSRSLWNNPPSTGRLLMVDWTPPASFSTRTECREGFFSSTPAKKKYRKEETVPLTPVSIYTASVNSHPTSHSAATTNRSAGNATARGSEPLLRDSKTSAILHPTEKPLLDATESRATHVFAADLTRRDPGFPRLTGVSSRATLSPWEAGQPLHTTVAQSENSRIRASFHPSLHNLKVPVSTTPSPAVGSSSRIKQVAHPLQAASKTVNSSRCSNSGAALPSPSRRALVDSKENKRNRILLHDHPVVPCDRDSRTVVPSRINVSNLNACFVSEGSQARLVRNLQMSSSDKAKDLQPVSSQDVLHLQSLPDIRFPFLTPAVHKSDGVKQVKFTTSAWPADIGTSPTEKEVNALLSMMLWQYNLGPYQFHPALLKAIYTEWARLHRSKGPLQEQQ